MGEMAGVAVTAAAVDSSHPFASAWNACRRRMSSLACGVFAPASSIGGSRRSAAMRSLVLSDFHGANRLNALSLYASVALCRPVSRMRAAAAASFCLSVAISAVAAAVPA
jgi:hypothetical protein